MAFGFQNSWTSFCSKQTTDDVLLRFIDHAMRFVERAEEAKSP